MENMRTLENFTVARGFQFIAANNAGFSGQCLLLGGIWESRFHVLGDRAIPFERAQAEGQLPSDLENIGDGVYRETGWILINKNPHEDDVGGHLGDIGNQVNVEYVDRFRD